MSTTENKGLKGTVKWFSNRKGFGFIASDALKEEIFVHQTGIVTNGQFRTLQESSKVKFDVEQEDGSGKLKAVNVTNEDGTPISPPPRQPRRVRAAGVKKENDTKKEGDAADKTDEDKTDDDDAKENKDEKNQKKGRKARNPRGKPKKETNGETAPASGNDAAAAADKHDKTPRDPPFHAVLTPEVKKKVETDRKVSLGQRTTVDVALGPDCRIKLGQGGYTAICLKTAVIGEGTFTCDATGAISFTWERALECKDGSWKKCSSDFLIKSMSLIDEKVGPVGPNETAAILWGEDKPDPREAFEANGFQMRRVVLTRPPGRFRRGGGHGGKNNRGGGGGGKKSEGKD